MRNKVDHDTKKYVVDAYGNLCPKEPIDAILKIVEEHNRLAAIKLKQGLAP